jgi:hypothetical protein
MPSNAFAAGVKTDFCWIFYWRGKILIKRPGEIRQRQRREECHGSRERAHRPSVCVCVREWPREKIYTHTDREMMMILLPSRRVIKFKSLIQAAHFNGSVFNRLSPFRRNFVIISVLNHKNWSAIIITLDLICSSAEAPVGTKTHTHLFKLIWICRKSQNKRK